VIAEDGSDDQALPVDAQTDEGSRSLREWQDELSASPGWRALGLMSYVRRVGYVFQANVAQLNTLAAQVQDAALSAQFFDIDTPEAHDDLLGEVERLLHNVLTALSTRIDQQRAFMRRNFRENAPLSTEYATRVTAEFGFAEGDFLRDLRNYLTHHRLPVTQSQQTFTQETMAVSFGLLPDPLKEWDRWKPTSRTWLSAQYDHIDIVDLVDGYARIAGLFDKWLHDAIGAQHADEIRQYEYEAEAFNREWDKIFVI